MKSYTRRQERQCHRSVSASNSEPEPGTAQCAYLSAAAAHEEGAAYKEKGRRRWRKDVGFKWSNTASRARLLPYKRSTLLLLTRPIAVLNNGLEIITRLTTNLETNPCPARSLHICNRRNRFRSVGPYEFSFPRGARGLIGLWIADNRQIAVAGES